MRIIYRGGPRDGKTQFVSDNLQKVHMPSDNAPVDLFSAPRARGYYKRTATMVPMTDPVFETPTHATLFEWTE